MDTDISQLVLVQRKKKVFFAILGSVLLLFLSVWLVRSLFKPTIKRTAINTAVVEKGDIENTITALGEVLPEFEQVITSPINASVRNVITDAGSTVKAGQSVLVLDKSASQTECEKLKFKLASKQNDIRKLKLELDKSIYDIKSNNNIKQLRINSLEAEVENTRRLYKAGGGTKEDIEKAELELKVARLEKQQLENEIKSKQQTMIVEMKEAEIAASIQESELHELERKLKLADIVGSRDGVVTWVNKNIGSTVREGDALARIADLSSFKVQGSVSDSYIDQIHHGMTAIVRINDLVVRGTVVNIQPSIQNGVVYCDIQLVERNNKLLRPNMKVDVFLVTNSEKNVMRVANGPAFRGSSPQQIFVVKNGKAEKRTVHTGMSNFDYVEIKDNVKPGDVVITSDMSVYKNTNALTITE
jgi:HlyD family secretion protein